MNNWDFYLIEFIIIVVIFLVALGADGLHFVVFVDSVGNVAAAEGAGQFLEEIAHLLAVGLVVQRVHPVHPAVALKQVACNKNNAIFKSKLWNVARITEFAQIVISLQSGYENNAGLAEGSIKICTRPPGATQTEISLPSLAIIFSLCVSVI